MIDERLHHRPLRLDGVVQIVSSPFVDYLARVDQPQLLMTGGSLQVLVRDRTEGDQAFCPQPAEILRQGAHIRASLLGGPLHIRVECNENILAPFIQIFYFY